MTTTPSVTDTRLQVLRKIVQAVYNKSSVPDPSLAPLVTDTRWQLIRKWNTLKNSS